MEKANVAGQITGEPGHSLNYCPSCGARMREEARP